MNNERFFDQWKERKRKIKVSEDFRGKVMREVHLYEQKVSPFSLVMQWLIKTITAHPLVQAAMIFAGAFIGLIRLVVMLFSMLQA